MRVDRDGARPVVVVAGRGGRAQRRADAHPAAGGQPRRHRPGGARPGRRSRCSAARRCGSCWRSPASAGTRAGGWSSTPPTGGVTRHILADQRTRRPGRPALTRVRGTSAAAGLGNGPGAHPPGVRLRRSDVNGPGYRRRRAGRGFAYYDDRRRADQGRAPRPDPRAGDPAGLEGRLDLPVAQRAHPGHRRRRGRPPAVPLPRPVAGAAGRREARAGPRDRPPAARRPRRRRRRRSAPAGSTATGCWPPPSGCWTSAPSASAASSTRRRTAPTGWPRSSATHVSVRGERTFFSYTAKGGIEREVEITDRPTATVVRQLLERPGGRRGGPARLPADDGDVARRHQRRDQRLPQGDQRRGDLRQGLPHLERDGAHGRRPRRDAAADDAGRRARRRSGRPTSGSRSSSATRPPSARPATSTRGWSTSFENGETVAEALRRGGGRRGRPGRAADPRAGRLPAAVGLRDDEGPAGNRRGLRRGRRACRRWFSERCCRRS